MTAAPSWAMPQSCLRTPQLFPPIPVSPGQKLYFWCFWVLFCFGDKGSCSSVLQNSLCTKDDLELLIPLLLLTWVLGLQVCTNVPGLYCAGSQTQDLVHAKYHFAGSYIPHLVVFLFFPLRNRILLCCPGWLQTGLNWSCLNLLSRITNEYQEVWLVLCFE